MKKHSLYIWSLFIGLSLIGVVLFITPINTTDGVKVPVAILANWLSGIVQPIIVWAVFAIFVVAAVGAIVMKFIPYNGKPTLIDSLFRVNWFWTTMRILAVIFGAMYAFDFGPSQINSDATAGVLMAQDGGLVTYMFVLFFFAGLLLPLLTDFGLLDFFGSMMVKIMRPIFKIPGRSSIDALASWVGDGTIGVLLTSKQYEDGNYTGREAATIATTFSVVSITFCLFIVETIHIESYFFEFYGTVLGVGLLLAFIMPRIYPLRQIKDTFIDGSAPQGNREEVPTGFTPLSFGLKNALNKAEENKNLGKIALSGIKNVLEMWFAVAPVIMAFGTIALILAEYTSIFRILGMPFEPFLSLLQIPHADEAAQTMIIGFADMLLPSVLGSDIESEMTRFVIATVSVTQLIYMSEVGGLILGTKLPLKLWNLFAIFLIRTIISLPVIALIAHIIF